MRSRALALAALALLVLTGCGSGKTSLVVGAVEDAPKWDSSAAAKAADAGFEADVLSAVWSRGVSPDQTAATLQRAVSSLDDKGVKPVVAVYQLSSQTPLTDADQEAFASYAAGLVQRLPQVATVIVGNEPNLNLFWMPQFDASGGDAAAAGFEQLLARTYDAIKAVRSSVEVIGGGLAPHGGDDATSSRPTHSPTQFILDLGAAYRASGRTKPLMDALSIHVYGESPRIPPSFAHPHTTSIGIADYDKLTQLIKQAFGKLLPIVYGEYGVETTVPPAKAGAYTGHEVVAAVDPATQAQYYADAIGLASCQPDVQALYLFHVIDENRLEGLQSGVYYADGTPKLSLDVVRQAINRLRCVR